jgi:hypothetical protein
MPMINPASTPADIQAADLAARDQLKDVASHPSITAETVCVVDTAENIPDGILSVAQSVNARGIVMGLLRRKYVELTAYLPWSTANDVIRGADRPVLTAEG